MAPGWRTRAIASVSTMRSIATDLTAAERQFGIEEAEVERGVMRDQRRIAEKFEQLVDALMETRLVRKEGDRQAVHALCLGGHVAIGMKIGVETAPGLDPVDQLDAADFDQPVTVGGTEAGRFGVEDDLAHDRQYRIPRARRQAMRMRTSAAVSRRVRPVAITKSARRALFGIGHLTREDSQRSGPRLMPGRASTRRRCIQAGAETTTTASTRRSPPVSNSSGTSSTTIRWAPMPPQEVLPRMRRPQDGRLLRVGAARRGRRTPRGPMPRDRRPAVRSCPERRPRSPAAARRQVPGAGGLRHRRRTPARRLRGTSSRPSTCPCRSTR